MTPAERAAARRRAAARKAAREQRLANRQKFSWLNRVVGTDAELKKLFTNAVNGNWDDTRFNAALRETNWFRTHGEAWRQAQVQKATDPKAYEEALAKQRSSIATVAANLGLTLTADELADMARAAYHTAWDNNQIVQKLTPKMDSSNGIVLDSAESIRSFAARQGVSMTDAFYNSAAREIAGATALGGDAGRAKMAEFEQQIRGIAASTWPAFAADIKEGKDVSVLADAWVKKAQDLLEDSTIDLKDQAVKAALQAVDAEGKPGVVPMYQFEKQLRKDDRWMKTQNGQETVSRAGRYILEQWGF